MRITLLEVENYKRIQSVQIAPGDRSMILIAGRNRQGKSSLLGAMSAALGGKAESAEEPIRHGAAMADIRLELDDGELVVHRRYCGDKTTLEVTSKDGKLRSPQRVLDRIVGGRFLDPIAFMRLKPKEQLEQLLQVVDLGLDLDAHAVARQKVFERRTDVNREVKRLTAVVEKTPEIVDLPAEASGSEELAEQIAELSSRKQRVADAQRFLATREAELGRMRQAIADLQARLAEYDRETADQADEAAALLDDDPDAIDAQLAELRRQLSQVSAETAVRAQAEAQNAARAAAAEELRRAKAKAQVLTEKIAAADAEKAAALAAATMPVADLEIGDAGLRFRGVPLSQASGAEQLHVSLALASAMSPELRDIWIEDGALLDSDSLALMERFASEHDLRIWLERVGEGDAGAVILEEGQVRP